jgi:methionine-gamma-lyase
MNPSWRFETNAIHSGGADDPLGAVAPPIYQTTTFAFSDAERMAKIVSEEVPGYYYTRWGNPTVRLVEEKLAALEGGEDALALASGMAAVSTALLTLLKASDHVVSAESVYSGTYELFTKVLPKFGVEVSLVDAIDAANYERAIRPTTRLFYLETPANPTMKVTDIRAVVELAQRRGLLTVMDNTFATPYNQQPLRLGVDVVVHAATKYLGGHSDVTAGIIVGSREIIHAAKTEGLRILGGVLDPFGAWLLIRGLKTLGLRMERHNDNTLAVARFLHGHPKVAAVHYPGLESHPNHAVARAQMHGFGGMLSFEVKGGAEAGRRLVEAVRLARMAVSLGGAETLIVHAASTTHAPVPREARLKAGISDGLIRLSVGIEHVEDILEDLEQALAQA